MIGIQSRIIYFLFLCIGTRLYLSYLINIVGKEIYKILTTIILIIGCGFLIIYFGGYRKRGLETGGKKIWWNNLRPVHGILYILAAIMMIYGMRYKASIVILVDTIIGLLSFLWYHINAKNIYI